MERVLQPLASVAGVTGLTAASGTRARQRQAVIGAPYVTDALAAFVPSPGAGMARLRRHPASFFQSNRYLVADLVGAVASLAARDEVVDLYAGVGLFAVSIAAMGGRSVTAVERDPSSARDLMSNAAPLAPAVQVVRTPVETYLKRCADLEGAVVIVDPPRTGLSREVVAGLVRRRAGRQMGASIGLGSGTASNNNFAISTKAEPSTTE